MMLSWALIVESIVEEKRKEECLQQFQLTYLNKVFGGILHKYELYWRPEVSVGCVYITKKEYTCAMDAGVFD